MGRPKGEWIGLLDPVIVAWSIVASGPGQNGLGPTRLGPYRSSTEIAIRLGLGTDACRDGNSDKLIQADTGLGGLGSGFFFQLIGQTQSKDGHFSILFITIAGRSISMPNWTTE